VIIDFHTHIFPPEVRDNREEYVRRDPTFAEMYANPKAKIATAEDLLASMDRADVDVSVTLGFAWQEHDLIVRHNNYLLAAAARSDGRIVPFAAVNMADERAEGEILRCANAGARGLGELRPENQGWQLCGAAGERLARGANEHSLVLLFHVTEPVVREYPGRRGCELPVFHSFARHNGGLKIVGAHFGGGIHQHIGELDPDGLVPDIHVDTAAHPYLHPPGDSGDAVVRAIPPKALLFGSDFPLISQKRQLVELRRLFTHPDDSAAVLGGNAQRLLVGLTGERKGGGS
jgi:predicted TIM-barrel fold metal-dependent hydrolase